MTDSDDDPIVSVLPIHFTNTLANDLHLYQFPLLARPLQVPPSAAQSGKKIKARVKRKVGRFEVHVPFDTRTEVWNKERGNELGQARTEDDQEKSGSQSKKSLPDSDPPRLTELRLRSERVPQRCAYVLGVVRDGESHNFNIRCSIVNTLSLQESYTFIP
jgi:DNA-directed RNA polymerase-3 subunit RPC5